MKKNNKKGFTIVELVIVIAVIAILAAVLIPTFSSVIKKAKVNNDIQLVRNLNTALATDNKKHATMQDALDAAAKFGYDVAKINASATDNEILWDSVNDVFCYLNTEKNALEYIPSSVADDDKLSVNSYLLWKISKMVDHTYSTYYTGDATTFTGENAITKGFDAGTTKGITAIEYKHTGTEQKVVIRTNSEFTNLIIDAPEDTVRHYGLVGNVNVVNVALSSYDLFGRISGILTVQSGRVVVKDGASTGMIVVDTTNVNAVKLDTEGSGVVSMLVAKDAAVLAKIQEGKSLFIAQQPIVVDNNQLELIKNSIARIGDVYYETIEAAIAAVPNNIETTIIMVANLEIFGNAGIEIPVGKEIIIDLNGLTIRNLVNESKSSQVFSVKGKLTIKDSTDTQKDGTGVGMIYNTYKNVNVGEWWGTVQYNYTTNVILNRGTLIVESGRIEQTASGSICYAIDTASGNTVIINGGHISGKLTAIRVAAGYNQSSNAVFTMNGGTVVGGNTGIWIQLPNSTGTIGATVTFNGGKVIGTKYAFYDYSYGQSYENVKYTITGGTFDGNQIFSYGADFEITGGTFNSVIAIKNEVRSSSIKVTGGTFNKEFYTYGENASLEQFDINHDKFTLEAKDSGFYLMKK